MNNSNIKNEYAEEVRREANHYCLQLSVKHGGYSGMVWGYISASGVVDVVKIDGIMNTFIFQHDNDPKHTTNAVKAHLEKNSGTVSAMD